MAKALVRPALHGSCPPAGRDDVGHWRRSAQVALRFSAISVLWTFSSNCPRHRGDADRQVVAQHLGAHHRQRIPLGRVYLAQQHRTARLVWPVASIRPARHAARCPSGRCHWRSRRRSGARGGPRPARHGALDARRAVASRTFLLLCEPEPVCQNDKGNCSSNSPVARRGQARADADAARALVPASVGLDCRAVGERAAAAPGAEVMGHEHRRDGLPRQRSPRPVGGVCSGFRGSWCNANPRREALHQAKRRGQAAGGRPPSAYWVGPNGR